MESTTELIQVAANMFNGLFPAFSALTGAIMGLFIAKYIYNAMRSAIGLDEHTENTTPTIHEWEVDRAFETIQAYEKQKNDHKVKNDDKPKNDWRLGDDGEMIEVSPSQFFSSNES